MKQLNVSHSDVSSSSKHSSSKYNQQISVLARPAACALASLGHSGFCWACVVTIATCLHCHLHYRDKHGDSTCCYIVFWYRNTSSYPVDNNSVLMTERSGSINRRTGCYRISDDINEILDFTNSNGNTRKQKSMLRFVCYSDSASACLLPFSTPSPILSSNLNINPLKPSKNYTSYLL